MIRRCLSEPSMNEQHSYLPSLDPSLFHSWSNIYITSTNSSQRGLFLARSSPAGLGCAMALDKLLRPVWLCRQAV